MLSAVEADSKKKIYHACKIRYGGAALSRDARLTCSRFASKPLIGVPDSVFWAVFESPRDVSWMVRPTLVFGAARASIVQHTSANLSFRFVRTCRSARESNGMGQGKDILRYETQEQHTGMTL